MAFSFWFAGHVHMQQRKGDALVFPFGRGDGWVNLLIFHTHSSRKFKFFIIAYAAAGNSCIWSNNEFGITK